MFAKIQPQRERNPQEQIQNIPQSEPVKSWTSCHCLQRFLPVLHSSHRDTHQPALKDSHPLPPSVTRRLSRLGVVATRRLQNAGQREIVSGDRRTPHHVDGSSTATRLHVNHTPSLMCGQDFVQKCAAEHQGRVAASTKPATTRSALIPAGITAPKSDRCPPGRRRCPRPGCPNWRRSLRSRCRRSSPAIRRPRW